MEIEAFKNKLGILFKILREGDSFNRFEREVACAANDGINVGNINDGMHFVNSALNSLEKIMLEKLCTVFTNIDPATKHQAEIWVFCDGWKDKKRKGELIVATTFPAGETKKIDFPIALREVTSEGSTGDQLMIFLKEALKKVGVES